MFSYIKPFLRYCCDSILSSRKAVALAKFILWRTSVRGITLGKSQDAVDSVTFYDFDKPLSRVETFLEYYNKNTEQIESLKQTLSSDMDELSQATVDRAVMIYRNLATIESAFRKSGEKIGAIGGIYCVPTISLLSECELDDARHWMREKMQSQKQIKNLKLPLFTQGDDFCDEYTKKRSLAYIDPSDWNIEGKDVLDGGANIGQAALIYSQLPIRSIHSFEPAADSYATLTKTISKNNLHSLVKLVNLATSDKSGILRFYSNGNNDQGASVIPSDLKRQCVEIKTTSIDDYVNANHLDVGLIKLDVEGAEYDTIIGATETIQKSKPTLIVSLYHTPKDFFEIKPYLERLGLGYRFMIRQTQYRIFWEGYELLAYIPHSWRKPPQKT